MKIKPYITAHARNGNVTTIVKVPVDVNGSIPTVPHVIQFEKDYYVLTSTNRLEYTRVSFGKATV